MTHKINRPTVEVEKIKIILQYVQNNFAYNDFPMNNLEKCLQILVYEVHYYRIWHINSVLAEVDMEFYHSWPIIQKYFRGMTWLESLAMSLKNSDNTNVTTTTITDCLCLLRNWRVGF